MPLRKLGLRLPDALEGAREQGQGDITPFNALMTSLSATIGTGNIAGVGTAIAIGGPGALFWMWMTALVGMATKYAEAVLAVRYREVDENNNHVGGPMYYIRNGLGKNWVWMATCSRSSAPWPASASATWCRPTRWPMRWSPSSACRSGSPAWSWPCWWGLVLIGGIRWIAQVAGKLVPLMAIAYLLAGLVVLGSTSPRFRRPS
jgi:AGCS family alanine or glycine:cation symporter